VQPDVAAARAWWRVQREGLAPGRLVFIDETWATTNMIRPRGRAPVGMRLIDKTPHGYWKTTTLIAGLRSDGLTAPLVRWVGRQTSERRGAVRLQSRIGETFGRLRSSPLLLTCGKPPRSAFPIALGFELSHHQWLVSSGLTVHKSGSQ
jgi:hypothetical protein